MMQMAHFEEKVGLIDFDGDVPQPAEIVAAESLEAQAYAALVVGVRDYIGKNGFPGVLVGLSGGVDSAVVATLDAHDHPDVTAASGIKVISGATAATFLIPVLLIVSLATFLLTLTISLSPSEDEVRADAEFQRRMEYLQRR